jgi:hypothetical protein
MPSHRQQQLSYSQTVRIGIPGQSPREMDAALIGKSGYARRQVDRDYGKYQSY